MLGYKDSMSHEEAAAENEGMVLRDHGRFKVYNILDKRDAYDALKEISQTLGISTSDYKSFLMHEGAERELYKKIIHDYTMLHGTEINEAKFKAYGGKQLLEIRMDMHAASRMENGE